MFFIIVSDKRVIVTCDVEFLKKKFYSSMIRIKCRTQRCPSANLMDTSKLTRNRVFFFMSMIEQFFKIIAVKRYN